MDIKMFVNECWDIALSTVLFIVLNFLILSLFLHFLHAFLIVYMYYSTVYYIFANEWYDRISCFLIGARPIKTNKEKNYLLPLMEKAGIKNYNLYIVNDFSLNAYAVGIKSIAITKGAINGFSKEQLLGIIFHELGHFQHGHTTAAYLKISGCGMFSIIAMLFRLIISLIERFNKDKVKVTPRSYILLIICRLCKMILFLFDGVSLLFSAFRSRKREYSADRFAHQYGYAPPLISALYLLDDIMPEGFVDMKQHVTRSHPYLYDRIAKLEGLMNEEVKG